MFFNKNHFLFVFARYLIASHTTDYENPMLFLNTLAVFVLVVAKFPNMHKVRIFGINADHWLSNGNSTDDRQLNSGLFFSLIDHIGFSNWMVNPCRSWKWKTKGYILSPNEVEIFMYSAVSYTFLGVGKKKLFPCIFLVDELAIILVNFNAQFNFLHFLLWKQKISYVGKKVKPKFFFFGNKSETKVLYFYLNLVLLLKWQGNTSLQG